MACWVVGGKRWIEREIDLPDTCTHTHARTADQRTHRQTSHTADLNICILITNHGAFSGPCQSISIDVDGDYVQIVKRRDERNTENSSPDTFRARLVM